MCGTLLDIAFLLFIVSKMYLIVTHLYCMESTHLYCKESNHEPFQLCGSTCTYTKYTGKQLEKNVALLLCLVRKHHRLEWVNLSNPEHPQIRSSL